MAQYVFALSNDKTKSVVDSLRNNTYINAVFESNNLELTEDILLNMADQCPVDYFYVIKTEHSIYFPTFDFSFKPADWDYMYVHMWNNDTTVRLYSKHLVKHNPAAYTDAALSEGKVPLKLHNDVIYKYSIFDIIFLSYDESTADRNFEILQSRFPKSKRVSGIKGIFEAHLEAARLANENNSDMFFVVDADAIILPDFTFDIGTSYNASAVHIWHARNPINDLEYGYGGIKLFPTKKVLDYTGLPIDITTSISNDIIVIPTVANITRFNTDPFSAWRAGFRECVKLSSKLISNQDNVETEARLEAWCTNGMDREFGEFTLMGANEGRDFGRDNANRPDQLRLINDFKWLESRFDS
jgi:hypothetical protein